MDHHVQYPAFDVSPFASPEPFGWAAKRGHSSAGRALAWHARGRRFDPAWLHHASPSATRGAATQDEGEACSAKPEGRRRTAADPARPALCNTRGVSPRTVMGGDQPCGMSTFFAASISQLKNTLGRLKI